MAKNNQRLKKRNVKIKTKYKELSQKKYNGKTLYRYDTILEMIADEFYVQPRTVRAILLGE